MSEHEAYPIPTTEEGRTMLLVMVGRDMRLLAGEVRTLGATMATKAEMEVMRTDLHKRIDDLSAEFKSRDKAISDEVDRKSIGSSLDRFLSLGTRILTFCLVLATFGGLVAAGVRIFDSIPAATAKGHP